MRRILAVAALAIAAAFAADAKTLRWSSQGDVATHDPHAQNESFTNEFNGQIYEQLLTRDKEEEGLTRANEQIKKLTGSYARGYRSPSWDLSPHSIELLLKHGFEYDSSMMGDDYTPYRVRQGDVIELEKPAVFGKTTRLIEMPISWTLDDYPHFEFIRTKDWILPGLMNYNLVLENWINDFLYMKKILKWGVITYTFHPFVIGRAGRMLMLEKLIKKLKAEGAVFMTLEQTVAEYDKRAPFKK